MYKRHVLVCDDEKDIVSAISIYLTSDGYEVIPARNGLEALDISWFSSIVFIPLCNAIIDLYRLISFSESLSL